MINLHFYVLASLCALRCVFCVCVQLQVACFVFFVLFIHVFCVCLLLNVEYRR